MYREFAITGLKLEIVPAVRTQVEEGSGQGGNNNNMLEMFNVWDSINVTTGWTIPNFTARFDNETFKMLDARNSHTVFKNNRPLAVSQNTPWFDANPSAFTVSTGGPRAVTVIGWKVSSPVGT